MSPVSFKKSTCRHVESKGAGPQVVGVGPDRLHTRGHYHRSYPHSPSSDILFLAIYTRFTGALAICSESNGLAVSVNGDVRRPGDNWCISEAAHDWW